MVLNNETYTTESLGPLTAQCSTISEWKLMEITAHFYNFLTVGHFLIGV